ncbi:MAG: L-aspartate oxidase [Bacillota bacterium]
MRRYVFSGNINVIRKLSYDVVIAGSGVAALYAALSLDEHLTCALINKAGREESNSIYAQGGIAAVIQNTDNTQDHFKDTLFSGAGLCNEEAVRVLVQEGPADIEKLIQLGVPFDTDPDGNIQVTREGAHSHNRILHCGGDATGYHLTKTLMAAASSRKNITIYDYECLSDICTDDNGRVNGIVTIDGDGMFTFFSTANVIIASGGIGRIYRKSTNAYTQTGDGIATAMRAGAKVENMEFVQFHPTALIHPDKNGRYFLISEALRGEGAVLRNRRWERFMCEAHPMADLAPRDIVTRAIIWEMKNHDLPNVYLDITSKSRTFLENRFPTIYHECLRRDIDIAVDWIPVVPVQHYFMGGIATDLNGRTNIEGLYACGEAANTGVHGANRLASNSLLECIVFGRRCAEHINGSRMSAPAVPGIERYKEAETAVDLGTIRTNIRYTMTKKGGIIRNKTILTEAIAEIGAYFDTLQSLPMKSDNRIIMLNMATVALAVLRAALKREKSVGAHYRSDEIKERAEKQ